MSFDEAVNALAGTQEEKELQGNGFAVPHVEVLLATFNGEAFLSQQLESLLSQEYQQWSALIHDDGSSDGTLAIIEKYSTLYPEKIIWLNDNVHSGSAQGNFTYLLQKSTAHYVMFCDQDDIWLKDKIRLAVDRILQHEKASGAEVPALVFSDLVVVDSDLRVISESLWQYQGAGPEFSVTPKLLALRNCLTGCTLLLNGAARNAVLPVSQYAVMHDWWCGLRVLLAGGVLLPVQKPTVLYRQHAANAVGAGRGGSLKNAFVKLMKFRQYANNVIRSYHMARHLGIYSSMAKYIFWKIMLLAGVGVKKWT